MAQADFPSNSIHNKSPITTDKKVPQPSAVSETASEPRQVKKVVTGTVVHKPKPLGKRFKEMFVHDGGSFAEELAKNVIEPMIKDMALSIVVQIGDGIKRGFEDMIFGPDENGRRRSNAISHGTGRPINYNRFSSPTTIRRPEGGRPSDRNERIRPSNRVKNLVVTTRKEGDDVIEELEAMIDSDIGYCTVGDYYAAMGESSTSTDEEWGWVSLRAARVVKLDHDEFVIEMPRPRPIGT
jgi:hypothetical protein